MVLLSQFLVVLKHQTFQANFSSILMSPCLKLLHLLQKKAIQIISFASFDAHTLPIFAKLNIFRFPDSTSNYLVVLQNMA